MGNKHIFQLKSLIQEAVDKGIYQEAKEVTGFSGEKMIGLLQRVAKYQTEEVGGDYLEVGVFQGLTLISVATALSKSRAYGIDNFAFFDRDNINMQLVKSRIKANQLDNVSLINEDYEDALENLSSHIGESKISTYFVDGPHDYRSQLMCLELIKPHLTKNAVIIIDDSNYRHVRLANRDFLVTNPEFKLLFESYTKCHPNNMQEGEKDIARKGFWNGINVLVHDPDNVLPREYPETVRTRDLYENDHTIHCVKWAVAGPETAIFLSALTDFRFILAFKKLLVILRKMFKTSAIMKGKYTLVNTYSEGLPQNRFNKFFSK